MNARSRPESAQRGVALLVALLVVALASLLIAALLDRGELAAARTRNQLREAQAQALARGLEGFAAGVLRKDAEQGVAFDARDDIWALPLPPTPVPGGTISAQMQDLNGLFNLDNLDPQFDTAGVWNGKFRRLLGALSLDPAIAAHVADWMNPDPAAGGDDGWYLAQPVAYRRARRAFSHVSELRLVRGVDGDAYARLVPFVTVLPAGTPININTAAVPVLMTLSPNLTREMAQAIWQQGGAHYRSVQDAIQAAPAIGVIEHPECYDVRSSYFIAHGAIQLDGLPFDFDSLIERRNGGPDGGIRVLQRSRGGDG